MDNYLNLSLLFVCMYMVSKLKNSLDTIQKNTSNMERYTSELLEKTNRLDHLFNALKQM